jgi:hypothetical protein
MLKNILTDDNRKKVSGLLFYVALTLELVLMLVEKSEISFSYESYVFRATFLLTLLAFAIMKSSRKETLVIALFLVFAFICYETSGKNDILRLFLFLAAARDIDLKKAMKYTFYVCLTGFILIGLLSVIGVMGDVALVADYGRAVGEETRYVFGFGHPNTLLGCVYAMILMWIWIYGRKASALVYGSVIVISAIASYITRSRTGVAVLAMTVALAVVLRIFPKISEMKLYYVLVMLVTPVLCIVSAVIMAGWSQHAYTSTGIPTPSFFWPIDHGLNNRISNLYYGVADHGGILSSWKLFAGRDTDGYFDLGWVRLFYWYGIIPTAVIAAFVIIVLYVCMKKKDAQAALIILSLSIYTVIEATFVTRYLGRDFFLLIVGVYLGCFLKEILSKSEDVKRETNG